MIREDYIISWIKRFIQVLAQIMGLMKQEQYQAAIQEIDAALQTLLDLGPDTIASLSDGEIMARLTVGEATQVVQTKCLMLAALLKQLALACRAQQRFEESHDCFLKALHIMLGIGVREDAGPLPDYAPKVEELLESLKGQELPPRTYAALVVYREQRGEFALAEDALHELMQVVPENSAAKEVGVGFYERLLARPDPELVAGNLPRSEVEAGLAEIRARA